MMMMMMMTMKYEIMNYEILYPRDYEILGWCPAGPVLPHGEKVPL